MGCHDRVSRSWERVARDRRRGGGAGLRRPRGALRRRRGVDRRWPVPAQAPRRAGTRLARAAGGLATALSLATSAAAAADDPAALATHAGEACRARKLDDAAASLRAL